MAGADSQFLMAEKKANESRTSKRGQAALTGSDRNFHQDGMTGQGRQPGVGVGILEV